MTSVSSIRTNPASPYYGFRILFCCESEELGSYSLYASRVRCGGKSAWRRPSPPTESCVIRGKSTHLYFYIYRVQQK